MILSNTGCFPSYITRRHAKPIKHSPPDRCRTWLITPTTMLLLDTQTHSLLHDFHWLVSIISVAGRLVTFLSKKYSLETVSFTHLSSSWRQTSQNLCPQVLIWTGSRIGRRQTGQRHRLRGLSTNTQLKPGIPPSVCSLGRLSVKKKNTKKPPHATPCRHVSRQQYWFGLSGYFLSHSFPLSPSSSKNFGYTEPTPVRASVHTGRRMEEITSATEVRAHADDIWRVPIYGTGWFPGHVTQV